MIRLLFGVLVIVQHMMSHREQLEREIAAQVGSWLDIADDEYGRGYEVKTWAFVFETEFPPTEEGGYAESQVGFTCSDTRGWIQAGLFRRAMLTAEREVHDVGAVDEPEPDGT